MESTTSYTFPVQTGGIFGYDYKTNHRKLPQITANHHKSPPEFWTKGIENSGKQANHCKPPPEFVMTAIRVLVKNKQFD